MTTPQIAVVGRSYRVPCVYAFAWRPPGWVPILGPLHEDAEIIQFPDHHWHVDWRFATKGMWFRATASARSPLGRPISRKNTVGPIRVRRLKCRRAMPIFPGCARWLPELQEAYRDCRIEKNMICPHRGLPLHGCPVVDGAVICPGHGLAWDLQTGELRDRRKLAEPKHL